MDKPDYLYNPEKCPCKRGPTGVCPRYKDCRACMDFHHHHNPRTPLTACERKAKNEGYSV